MLQYPGILVPIFRQVHTDMALSTRRTFLEQVLPPELRERKDLVKIRQSQGNDYVEFLWNGSSVHFVGLDRPGRVFGTEFGAAMFDEAHEMLVGDITTVYTRLRQRCTKCLEKSLTDCTHMPHRMVFAFNPSYPGHWLQEWFMMGATQTELGFKKDELFIGESGESAGSCEFFRSYPTDNPFLPESYINKNLASLPPWKKRRFLMGLWEHEGGSFFDDEAIATQEEDARKSDPLVIGELAGDLTGTDDEDRQRVVKHPTGRLLVFQKPVRWHVTKDGNEIQSHRYVVAVDASSGAGADYSAVQVISVEELEQVAEWQGKIDPDKLAEVAFLLACIYNGAMLAPEITGGWGFAVVKRVQAMIGNWQGSPKSKPTIYTRPIVDRLSQKFTDRIGWDTNVKSRGQMLDVLEQTLRDGSLTIHGLRTLAELSAFALPDRIGEVGDYRSPRAQKGAHDDLVIALAIGVAVATKLPRNQKPRNEIPYQPVFEATGW